MQRSLWLGLMVVALGATAFADPQAKVRKVSNQENSYTYYNWKPKRAQAQPPAQPSAPAPASSAAPATPTAGYTPIRPTPALLNPATAGGYSDPGLNYPPPQQMPPPAYYGPAPQTYFSSPYFSNSGFYSSGYSYPGLQVSNSGYSTGISLSGVYRNGNVTIRAGNAGFYGPGYSQGFYGPGFQGGYNNGGFRGGGFRGGGFRGGSVCR